MCIKYVAEKCVGWEKTNNKIKCLFANVMLIMKTKHDKIKSIFLRCDGLHVCAFVMRHNIVIDKK